MSEKTQDTRIRLIAQGPDLWRVQVLFEFGLEAFIPEKLRDIKTDLAQVFGVPDSLLEYMQLLSKRRTEKGILVEMQIRKQPIPSGAPITRYLPMTGEDGTEYSNMLIEADIYPIDTYGKKVTRRTIEAQLTSDGVDLALVDWKVVDDVLREIAETAEVKREVTIGRGKTPDTGQHSMISYPVSSEQHRLQKTAWMGLRLVEPGETLIEVSMAVSGLKYGKNVFGREIGPRKPIQSRLEAGLGCSLSAMGNRLTAHREGMLVIHRQFHDRRIKDSAISQPLKVISSIVDFELLEGDVSEKLSLRNPTLIRGDLKSGSLVHSNSHLLVEGNLEPDSQIDCLGSLRIIGDVKDANLSAKEHLCICGKASNSMISCDLTIQIDGDADRCTVYAREIFASHLEGGTAEALTQSMSQSGGEGRHGSIQINYQKFLEVQQAEGVIAIKELREQMSIVNDLFGHDIVRKVSEDNVQLMLLRWLREQKARNITSYSFKEVQTYREILSVIPFIRSQLSAVGEELRSVTSRLNQTERGDKELSEPPEANG